MNSSQDISALIARVEEATVSERTPHDGRPYYCADCGAGYAEWLACDAIECGALEIAADAEARVLHSQTEGGGDAAK